MRLTAKTRKERLDEILDQIIENDARFAHEIESVKKQLIHIEQREKFYYHKVGVIRFNPFERVGGEQSFVIAVLDSQNSGLTMNFIYTREGLRVYTKKVKEGKGEQYELSEEEKKAIEESK